MKKLLPIIATTILLLHGTTLVGQSYEVKNYTMTVSGTSTLHDWVSEVGTIDCKGSYTLKNNTLADLNDVVVKIKVASIKSTKGKTMDNKTYEAFDYKNNPEIIFTLTKESIDAATATVKLGGTLTMAGVSKPIDLSLNYKILTGGELKIIGSKKISMTDFGMEPPTAMMGTIKVGNDVVVSFDITLTHNNKI